MKIEVTRGGLVRIPATDLAAYGLSAAPSRSPLRLTNAGRSVPYRWERRPDGVLELVFTALPLRTDYSDRNVYVLAPEMLSRGPAVPLTRSADPEVPGFLRAEREQLYIPSLPAGADPWQWDILFSGAPWPDPGYDPAAGDFDLPDLALGASGPATVRLRVVGYTHHRHSVTASINGLPVGSVTFDGIGPALLSGTIAAEALHRTGNQLSIDYVGAALSDSPASDAFAYLDYADLGVPRATAGPAAFTLAPWSPRLPSLGGVDYLVVTHPLFREQADRIAAEKTKGGHRAAVVETPSAYDRFSGGFVEARAIQALVRHAARASGVLRHVLLVGDDSFDPLDYSGRGVPSFVPSLFARDSGWGLVPSENLYADLDDDGLPDVAIGRLPVRTAVEADAVADKIATQEAALQALAGQLAVADNSTETDAPFREDAAARARPLRRRRAGSVGGPRRGRGRGPRGAPLGLAVRRPRHPLLRPRRPHGVGRRAGPDHRGRGRPRLLVEADGALHVGLPLPVLPRRGRALAQRGPGAAAGRRGARELRPRRHHPAGPAAAARRARLRRAAHARDQPGRGDPARQGGGGRRAAELARGGRGLPPLRRPCARPAAHGAGAPLSRWPRPAGQASL